MTKCGFRGTVQVPSAVPFCWLHAKGKKYLEMFFNCLNNGKKTVQGLNYSLMDGEGLTYLLQT